MPRLKKDLQDKQDALKDLRPIYELLKTDGGVKLKNNLKKGLTNDLKWLLEVTDVTDDTFQKELYVRFARLRATLELLKQFEEVNDEVYLLTEELTQNTVVDVL
jgi:hypothetical protein